MRAIVRAKINQEDFESHNWTTKDEIDYLRGLFQRGKIDILEKYQKILPYRTFVGPGMFVDAELVAMSIDSLIDELKNGLRR